MHNAEQWPNILYVPITRFLNYIGAFFNTILERLNGIMEVKAKNKLDANFLFWGWLGFK